jgi:hypothetical protein
MQPNAILKRLRVYKDMLFSKNYSISVPEPCHQKWEDMHLTAGGRFCDSCATNVVDFTGMTEKEIVQYFRNKQNTGCGRFEAGQLEKKYVARPHVRLPFHQRFFSYLLTFFVSNVMVNKASAQTDTTAIVQPDTAAQIAGNDPVLVAPDSLAVVQVDTSGCKDDSVSVSLEINTEEPGRIFFVDPGIVTVGIVCGGFYVEPINTEPGFLDLFKTTYRDTLVVLKRITGVVKEEQIPEKNKTPETPEKPAKKDTAIASAVLPDELKLKGKKRI